MATTGFASLVSQESVDAETFARAFAVEFPSQNVQAAVMYAEAGVVTWAEIGNLFAKALAKGVKAVTA